MTRTQIQQLVVVLLLILFVAVFLLSNKPQEQRGTPAPAPAVPAAPAETPSAPAAPAETPAEAVSEAPADLSIPRDIFLLPPALLQQIRQKEQAAEQAEMQKQTELEKDKLPKAVTADQVGITDLKLQGIFWGTANPQAIINRKIVSVGDLVEDAEVQAITQDSVTLSRNGQEFELKPENFRSSNNQGSQAGGQSWSSGTNLR